MIYFLDSNICIYFMKGLYPKVMSQIKKTNPNNIKIPSIVKAELLYGAEKSKNKVSNLSIVTKFLEPFQIIPFDDEYTGSYSKIRSTLEQNGNIIGPNDYIIAATVLAHNGILITNNEKEFRKVKNLKIDNWII